MKRARQIGMMCSVLLTLQSGVMGVLLLWFNRFSTDIFYHIPNLRFSLLSLYLSFLLGITCIYTILHYTRPGLGSATFFMVIGVIGLINTIQITNTFFLIYTVLLSLGFIYVGIVGYYYRQLNSKVYEGNKNDQRKNQTI